MTEGVPDKKVDEDWKRRVAEEKTSPPPSRPLPGTARPGPGAPPPRTPREPSPAPRSSPRSPRGPEAPRDPPARGASFLQFLNALAAQALVSLGQIEHPLTGQFEQDLTQARNTIETLCLLQSKTQGNLTPEEDQALAQIIQELQLAYVQLAS